MKLSSNTLSVLFVKHKKVALGRALCFLLGSYVYLFWGHVETLDILFILFFLGLAGVVLSMPKPFSHLHMLSLPFLFVPYVILPIFIDSMGLAIVVAGILFGIFFWVVNKHRLNALVQLSLLAPTVIFITIVLLTA